MIGTLYNVILRIAMNFLEIKENMEISCYVPSSIKQEMKFKMAPKNYFESNENSHLIKIETCVDGQNYVVPSYSCTSHTHNQK